MFKFARKNKIQTEQLYNKIVSLSRQKFLYREFHISDTFFARINLIFFHISFILTKLKSNDNLYKDLSQSIFDFMFIQIENNMREVGYGDVSVNKNMKKLINSFYNILIKCEKFSLLKDFQKKEFLMFYFADNGSTIDLNIDKLINYFEKYHFFSINLSINNIKSGNINFSYN